MRFCDTETNEWLTKLIVVKAYQRVGHSRIDDRCHSSVLINVEMTSNS